MNWIRLAIRTTQEGVEPLTGKLLSIGVNGFEIEDQQEIFHLYQEDLKNWGETATRPAEDQRVTVSVYLPDNPTSEYLIHGVEKSIQDLKSMDSFGDFGDLSVNTAHVKEEDWANNWKQHFKSFSLGKRMRIQPTWEAVNAQELEHTCVLRIDPSMLFGSGTHESTQLCLEAMEAVLQEDDFMLDIGCGSGILGLMAILLGAKKSILIDLDPNVAEVVLQNAIDNQIDSDQYQVMVADILKETSIQEWLTQENPNLICANIVADVLIELEPIVRKMIKPGGKFVGSGIIRQRQKDVEKVFLKQGWTLEFMQERGEWVAMVFQCPDTL